MNPRVYVDNLGIAKCKIIVYITNIDFNLKMHITIIRYKKFYGNKTNRRNNAGSGFCF